MEEDASLLYPKIDMAGNLSGIIGSEFPIFNYLIYLFFLMTDFNHWAGRLINLLVSSIGIFYFYKLIRKLFNPEVAFSAGIVLLCSIWFAFSRKIMPDTFSVSLVLIGLYYSCLYLSSGAIKNLFLFFLFASLGILSKLPAIFLLSWIPVLLISKQLNTRRSAIIAFTAIASAIPALIWYFHWVPELVSKHHFQLYFPKTLSEGILEIYQYWPGFFEKFYFASLSSYLGFAAFILGMVLLFFNKRKIELAVFGMLTLVFLVFTVKTGSIFPTHNYYVIPYAPVMALVAGFGLQKFKGKLKFIFLALIAIEGVANQQHDFFIRESQLHKLFLEEFLDTHVSKNDLIVINGGQSPQEIYFANRKGWTLYNEDIRKPFIDSLAGLGAAWLVINKNRMDEVPEMYLEVKSDKHYSLYSLQNYASIFDKP